jgi:hypothetical protein
LGIGKELAAAARAAEMKMLPGMAGMMRRFLRIDFHAADWVSHSGRRGGGMRRRVVVMRVGHAGRFPLTTGFLSPRLRRDA